MLYHENNTLSVKGVAADTITSYNIVRLHVGVSGTLENNKDHAKMIHRLPALRKTLIYM